eukprot:6342030-Amphidinium_carterae.1
MLPSQVAKFQCEDLRVLPVRYDSAGDRRVSFADGVASMDGATPSGGLGLDGPATCLWLCKHISHHDVSPVSHHERWLRMSKVAEGDRSVHEHEVLLRILGDGDAHIQLIKQAHSVSGVSPDYSSSELFLGLGQTRAGA